MKNTGINLTKAKETNRALLLQLICTSGRITRTELSVKSQLSPMTITNIVNEFLAQKLIEEIPPEDTVKVPGRTPMLLQISPASPVVVGIRMTSRHLYGIVGNLSMSPIVQKTVTLSETETEETILDKLRQLAEGLIADIDRPILGLGISTAGVINREKGVIEYITNFFNIKKLDLRSYLTQFFDFPVYVCNDIHAAALCELYFGHGQTEDNFLYVGLTHGIAASIIFERKLLDFCGEMGHMTIDYHGPKCACGSNGCLELYASTPNLLRQIAAETGVVLPDMESAVQFALSNRTAYAVFYNAMRQLSYGINNYLNLYSVPTVILGHDSYLLPDEIVEQMENSIASINISMHHFGSRPKLVKSKLGMKTQLYGSLCVVLQHLFQDGSAFSYLPAES